MNVSAVWVDLLKVDFRDSNSPDIYKLNTDFSNFDYTLCCVNSNIYRLDNMK